MTLELQNLIDAAQKLSPPEQLSLIGEISKFLPRSYQQMQPRGDFWYPKTLKQHVQAQGASPVKDIASLQVDFWPEEETADDIIEYLYQQRQDDLLRL